MLPHTEKQDTNKKFMSILIFEPHEDRKIASEFRERARENKQSRQQPSNERKSAYLFVCSFWWWDNIKRWNEIKRWRQRWWWWLKTREMQRQERKKHTLIFDGKTHYSLLWNRDRLEIDWQHQNTVGKIQCSCQAQNDIIKHLVCHLCVNYESDKQSAAQG